MNTDDKGLMTTFRADVPEHQVNEIYLPPPERLSRVEALTLASWAVTLGVPAEDDPLMPPRIQEMFGHRAAQNMQQLNKHLAARIGPHVAIAARHSLIVELDSDEAGQYFHVVRRRARAPDLSIRHKSAMLLLESLGLFGALPTETRAIDMVSRALARSQAVCIDMCMGHYHTRMIDVVSYGALNKARTISWVTTTADGKPFVA